MNQPAPRRLAPASRPEPPRARLEASPRVSWLWLVPLGALLLVGYLVSAFLTQRGPLITITFDTADGLAAGQTPVKYRAVSLGTVESIELGRDLEHVIANVRMTGDAEPLLTSEARFWIVRPRLGGRLGAMRAGLETLVSGTYVAIDPGRQRGPSRRSFEGSSEPPAVRSDEPGKVYYLEGESLGGITTGAPVICRDVEVGEVLGYELPNRREVRIRIFVREPYDTWVTDETRFWNASGVRVHTGSEGLKIELLSAQSLLSGGIAFGAPHGRQVAPSPSEATFHLHPTRAEAEIDFFGETIEYVSYFQSDLRGLARGAGVHVLGHRLGTVTSVELASDPQRGGELAARVAYVLQPGRGLPEEQRSRLGHAGIGAWVAEGMRVVLETESLLTGQKGLSLERLPGRAGDSVALVREGEALVLPGTVRGFDQLSKSLSDAATSLGQIPFERIGKSVSSALASVDQLVSGSDLRKTLLSAQEALSEVRDLARKADSGLTPLFERLPKTAERLDRALASAEELLGQNGFGASSNVSRSLGETMQQLGDAARSIRLLADYLRQHPESLLRGRGEAD